MVCFDLVFFGVMFFIDIEFGFDQVVFIILVWGLGEMVVQGVVNLDEFYVYKLMLVVGCLVIVCCIMGLKKICMVYVLIQEYGKQVCIEDVLQVQCDIFLLSNEEVQELVKQVVQIEKYYGCLMDIEWVKDGYIGKLFIVQVCFEIVCFCGQVMECYIFYVQGQIIVEGCVIGYCIGVGLVKVIYDISEMNCIESGDVLVIDMIDLDWELIMKKVLVIVINCGGCICYVVIIVCELGILVVVGCGDVIDCIQENQNVIVFCVEGDIGYVYVELFDFSVKSFSVGDMLDLLLKVMMNVGNLDCVFDFVCLLNEGVGLVWLEFIINCMIGVYLCVLLEFDDQELGLQNEICELMKGYDLLREFYVGCLIEGIVIFGVVFYLKWVIVCLLDFKLNEYVNLVGGECYELEEENLMFGFCGVGCYVFESFCDCFVFECEVMKCVCNDMGLINVEVMVLFVCIVVQVKVVVEELECQGLKCGENGLKIIMMCEILLNVLLVEQFFEYFDGFFIGLNDMI